MRDDSRAFQPADEDARRRAVETLDRPMLVEAGAGTGKTTLLVRRLLHALEIGNVRMPGIVAITFTEKAAAELRLRLRQALEKRRRDLDRCAAGDCDATDRHLAADVQGDAGPRGARLHEALRQLDGARISTIHAFAASILRERPVEAKLDPQFRTLDELEARQFLRASWSRWLDTQLEGDQAAQHLRAALLAGVRLEPDLYELARALYEQRDVTENLRAPRPPADLEHEMRSLLQDMLHCVRHAEDNCLEARDPGLVKLRALGKQLEALEDLETSSWPGVFLSDLELGITAGRREAWRSGTAAESKAMRRQLKERLAILCRQIGDDLLHGVLAWLGQFREDHENEKRRRGVLDFEDLLLRARALVRDEPRVRRDFGRRIEMLCVDEFQDTDPLQAELVLFLAEDEARSNARAWQDVRVGRALFLVGDPKQSIYRFRRADLEVYARCAEIVLESGGLRLDIVQNFRSRPAVIQWTNGVFDHLFGAGSQHGPRQVPLVPLQETGDRAAVWILKPAPARAAGNDPAASGSVEADAEGVRRAEARTLVRWLARALHEGWEVRDLQTGASRPLRAGDVAMLFGRTSGIEHYEQALRRAGIPFQQEGGRLFFRRQEVRDVLHALAAIDDPYDEMSIVAALRSSLFGASDAELLLHRAHAGTFSYLVPAPGSRLEWRMRMLRQLHAERHERGVAGTIVRLLDVTQARAVHAVRPQGARALTNFEMLQRRARQFEVLRPTGLREFVASLRDLDRDAPRLAEWAPDEDREERVRLLTVHMAKGLEFPCVLLANLNTRGNTRPDPVLVDRLAQRAEVRLSGTDLPQPAQTAGYAAVLQAEREREEAEERRLLYVAVTRARDYLVVPDFAARAPSGHLAALHEVQGALGDRAFGELPAPVPGAQGGLDARWCVAFADELPDVPPYRREPVRDEDVRDLLRRRAQWETEHARRLQRGTSGTRLLRPPDERPEELDGGAGEDSAARRLRRVVQRVLERAPSGADASSLQLHVREAASELGDVQLGAQVQQMVLAARRHEIEKRAAQARRVWRGLDLCVRVGGDLLEAHADLVLEEAAGCCLVLYSTLASGLEDLEELPARQEELVLWRVMALDLAGMRVHEAGTLFLSPGRFVPVRDLEPKVEALRTQLTRSRSEGAGKHDARRP